MFHSGSALWPGNLISQCPSHFLWSQALHNLFSSPEPSAQHSYLPPPISLWHNNEVDPCWSHSGTHGWRSFLTLLVIARPGDKCQVSMHTLSYELMEATLPHSRVYSHVGLFPVCVIHSGSRIHVSWTIFKLRLPKRRHQPKVSFKPQRTHVKPSCRWSYKCLFCYECVRRWWLSSHSIKMILLSVSQCLMESSKINANFSVLCDGLRQTLLFKMIVFLCLAQCWL